MRKFKFYMEEVSNDGSEFELIFEIDGKFVDKKVEYSVEDCLIDSYEFFRENCEKYEFDGRIDSEEVFLPFLRSQYKFIR